MYRFIFLASFILVCLGFKEEPVSRLPWHRPFYAEMKALEKPARVQAAAAVQTASNYTEATNSVAVTVSSTSANNLLVVSITMPPSLTISSVTDNQSSSYTIIGPQNAGGTPYGRLYQAYAICAAAVTTVTVTASGVGVIEVVVDEYSGVDPADPYDIHATGSGTGTSLSVSLTPAASGKLIVASMGAWYVSLAGNWTAGTGYTLYGLTSYPFGVKVLRSQYKLSSSTSETAPATVVYSFTDGWAEIATSFNLAPEPSGAPALNAAGNKPK